MSTYDHPHGNQGTTSTGDSAGPEPGKRTLTGALPPSVASRASAELGHDFSSVSVHQDGQAEALGAQAFARGDQIHVAAGVDQPAILGHELTHVAQQREGRVAATGHIGGVEVNNDARLEAEADTRGDRIGQGFQLDSFLDYRPPAMTAGAASVAQGKGLVVQGLDLGAGAPTTYTVLAGDSIAVIAKKLGTTVEAVKQANADQLQSFPTKSGGTVQGFRAGAVIKVPAAPGAAAAGASSSATGGAATAAADPGKPAADSGGSTWLDSLSGAVSSGLDAVGDVLNDGAEAVSAGVDKAAGLVGDAWSFLTGGATTPAPAAGGNTGATGPAGDDVGGVPAGGATAGGGAGGVTAAPPMADLTDAQRGEQLSTFHADELGTIDKFGMSKTGRDAAKERGEWLTAKDISTAGKNKSGQAFVDSVDALVGKTKFGEDQTAIITAAKDFATAPKELDAVQEAKSKIDWGKALLTLDGVSLNSDLQGRLERFCRFLAWAGLVTGPTTIGSVMRSPKDAHKLSVAWMFNTSANTSKGSTLHKAENRQKLVANVTADGGTDADGNAWLSDATVEGLKAKKDDDAALFAYIKSTAAPEAQKVKTQGAIAAEGYRDADKRKPNVLGGTGVSNHLLGEAVDMYPKFVFNNLFDPLIDAIAMYFGLWRAVKDDSSSPEHWHYERLGSPPAVESSDGEK